MPIPHFSLSYDVQNILISLLREESCLALSLKKRLTFLLPLHFLLQ